MRPGASRVQLERSLGIGARPGVVVHRAAAQGVEAAEAAIVDVETVQRRATGPQQPMVFHLDREGRRHPAGDLILHVEEALGGRVVSLRPELAAGRRLDEMGRDAHGLARPPHATAEPVSDGGGAVGTRSPGGQIGGAGGMNDIKRGKRVNSAVTSSTKPLVK